MRRLFVPAALLFAGLTNAATPINGWYSSLFGGYAYVPNNINVTRNGLTRSSATYFSGYDAGGNFGYKSNPMRYEGELTYLNVDLDKFRVNRVQQRGVNGYNNAFLAMANAYYDFPDFAAAIQPYLGVGIGYAFIHAKLNSTGPLAPTHYNATNTLFAYQATAGLTYNFAENYALNVGYRYAATKQADAFGKMFQANLANVGATYRFDEARYK